MATSEEINELKNLILDRFDKLYDDRVTKKDFSGIKKDLERVENKLERKIERLEDKVDLKIDKVSSQVKDLNEMGFFDTLFSKS